MRIIISHHKASISKIKMLKSSTITQFVSGQTQEQQTPLLASSIELFINGTVFPCVSVKLFDNHVTLTLINGQEAQNYQIRFCFSLCFETIREQSGCQRQDHNIGYAEISHFTGIKFDREDQQLEFRWPKQQEGLQMWIQHLKKKLNQRGFHEKYKAIKKIGEGHFAKVYQVVNIQQNKQSAAKCFSKAKVYEEKHGKACLVNEIQVMRSFDHPNLMKVEEVYETDNSIYIIIELLGAPINESIRYSNINKRRNIVRDVLSGLVEMHSNGVMHRDLKPENILYRPKTGNYVIADFGLTQRVNNDNYIYIQCGTPGYVAPEILNIKKQTQKYSQKCDIFSLGIVFYILLLKDLPYQEDSKGTLLEKNKQCNIQLTERQKASLQKQELSLLTMMIEKDETKRVSAVEALAHPYFNTTTPQASQDILTHFNQLVNGEEVKKAPKKKPKVTRKAHKKQQSDENRPPVTQGQQGQKEKPVEGAMEFKQGDNLMVVHQAQNQFEGLNSPAVAVRPVQSKSAFHTAENQWQCS